MNLTELVQQAGFSAGYLLPVPQYEEWTRRRASGAFAPEADWIEGDPAAAWPWANGLLLLIWPYAPYAPDAVLSGWCSVTPLTTRRTDYAALSQLR